MICEITGSNQNNLLTEKKVQVFLCLYIIGGGGFKFTIWGNMWMRWRHPEVHGVRLLLTNFNFNLRSKFIGRTSKYLKVSYQCVPIQCNHPLYQYIRDHTLIYPAPPTTNSLISNTPRMRWSISFLYIPPPRENSSEHLELSIKVEHSDINKNTGNLQIKLYWLIWESKF